MSGEVAEPDPLDELASAMWLDQYERDTDGWMPDDDSDN